MTSNLPSKDTAKAILSKKNNTGWIAVPEFKGHFRTITTTKKKLAFYCQKNKNRSSETKQKTNTYGYT